MDGNEQPLILVVEDDPYLNTAICETLRSYDFVVDSCSNGVEALAWLRQHRPDVILCDIMMPQMDGYTLLKHTRADLQLRTLPFIFLTARTSPADQRLAREIGVEDYLTKPVDSENLVIAIRSALRRQQIMQEEMYRQMDALRNRIVTILQHEFRTPLTFVLGYAQLLLEAADSGVDRDELRSAAVAILDGGHRLQRLIEGFLMLAELQNAKLKTEELADLNALDLWQSLAQEFWHQLHEQKLAVIISEQNSQAMVNGHPDLLHEALKRIMDNAIRYRRPASQKIQLSVEQVPPYVGFRIIDEGVGMPPEMVQRFSTPFEQADRENRTTPGAGIGLAIVNQVALLHGGKLDIDSEVGKGSQITLWLPAAVTSSARTST
jgi:signal transduction histidine kinase